MRNCCRLLLSALLLVHTSCQSPPPAETPLHAAPPAPAAPLVAVRTAAEARATVARFILTLPNPQQYAPDSARVSDHGGTWQVLVPRADSGRRGPATTRFDVSKTTGFVRSGGSK